MVRRGYGRKTTKSSGKGIAMVRRGNGRKIAKKGGFIVPLLAGLAGMFLPKIIGKLTGGARATKKQGEKIHFVFGRDHAKAAIKRLRIKHGKHTKGTKRWVIHHYSPTKAHVYPAIKQDGAYVGRSIRRIKEGGAKPDKTLHAYASNAHVATILRGAEQVWKPSFCWKDKNRAHCLSNKYAKSIKAAQMIKRRYRLRNMRRSKK